MNNPAASVEFTPAIVDSNRWLDEAWERSITKLRVTSRRIGDTFPHVAKQGRYDAAPVDWWTSGFWPGLLWLAYRGTNDHDFRSLAEACEHNLDQAIKNYDELHHDVGFMWMPTSVARYKLLGSEDSRRRALLMASLLAGRFNLRGQFIRAWNHDTPEQPRAGWAIVDCLMNLSLLFWASETCRDPRFKYIAMAHADTALTHFVRPDGSTRHIVSFDPVTGEFIEELGGQGFAKGSAWSRGCAWALYGYALCYRYTREERYLEAARRIARFFIANLGEEDLPRWDFRAPLEKDPIWDSSAGACAASGMLELSQLTSGQESAALRQKAAEIVKALDTRCGAWNTPEEGLLRFGTGNKPANENVHVSLIYGDFFFVESLAKLRGQTETWW